MNLCDKWLSQFYGKMPFEDYTLLDRAARTLEINACNFSDNKFPWAPYRAIQPSCIGFPGIWNWDSAFHAMAVMHWNPEFARDQIRVMLSIQRPNGKIPDVWWKSTEYQGCEIFDGGSKPPVLAWAAWEVEETDHNDEFLKLSYEGFVRNEDFWMKMRGGNRDGMCHYDGDSEDPAESLKWGGWESGWDNSPRWDGGVNNLFAVDLNCYMVLLYRALAKMADRLGRTEESAKWSLKAKEMGERIESILWDEESGCYFDWNYQKNKFNRIVTPASFMPLFIGTASRKRAAKLADAAKEHMMPGWPSASYKCEQFDPEGYWRGLTWLNVAYFALKGLKEYGYTDIAEAGKKTILDWVRNDPGTIYENYNPLTGAPANAPLFGWSCAFVIKFLLDWDLPLSL